ncbi:MAG: hypothetical protein HN578_17220 [Rhodospirillales bacterium]|jgi:hypothetical protein|nr:hypothetical protein [Rhodospirillales bacterium]
MDEDSNIIPLSQIVIHNHDVVTFADLLKVVTALGERGMTLMEFDFKPDFPDTPRDWQTKLEIAFSTRKSTFSRRKKAPEICDDSDD